MEFLCAALLFITDVAAQQNNIEEIFLRYYTGNTMQEYTDIPLSQSLQLLMFSGFDRNASTVVYTHGFLENAQKESVQVMVRAYLEAQPATNVVLLDWSSLAHYPYLINACQNTEKVGTAVAEQFHKLFDAGLPIDRVHFIGHSLGSHVVGYIARELKNKYNKLVKRLTALDPAFPGFYPNGVMMEHVNATDAEFVDVIHTDPGWYGAPKSSGTADFWPNEGRAVQPGCPLLDLSMDDSFCSHWRSWRFYAESVRNPYNFPASPGESYRIYNHATRETGLVYMGYLCNKSASGSYYLTTNEYAPYGRGMNGL